MRYLILAFLPLFAVAVATQNCNGTSIGQTPLNDLAAGNYQGFVGGLYPAGSNDRPAAHEAAGVAIAASIQPRDINGNVDVQNGRIVLLSIGMSNTTQEFSTFVPISDADPQRNGRVVVVDGAQGGQHAGVIVDPNARFWTVIEQRLSAAGVSPLQVAALWIKQAVPGPTDPFPQHARALEDLLAEIARVTKVKYGNVALCYLSSRIYAGYATTSLNPEPYAYESGFTVKWLIEAQINGQGNLNYDPTRGAVVAPWLSWGPYLWADGVRPRSDGLIYVCDDFQSDGTHPATGARLKVANMLNDHFRGDTTSVPWYLGGGGGVRAGVVAYGAGCPGGRGIPEVRHPSAPYLGNPTFQAQLGNAAASSVAALLLGSARTSLRLTTNCTLLVDPGVAFTTLSTRTNTSGRASIGFAIPNDLSLTGALLPTQWFIADPQGEVFLGAGITLSPGAEWRFGMQ